MISYCHLICIVGFSKLTQSKNICNNNRNGLVCCSNYHVIKGKCVACPLGLYGVNCSDPCPEDFYGEFCENQCRCSANKVCHVVHGCVDYYTEVISSSLFKTELQTATVQRAEKTLEPTNEQTTEQQDIESGTEHSSVPLLLFLVSVGCSSLLFISCLLIICRKIRHTRRGNTHNNEPTLERAIQDVFPHVDDTVIAEASGSDYAEIRECNHTYSSCAEASSIYNVLSFSRPKYRNETFNTVSGIYSRSESCSTQRKVTDSLEQQSAETDNAQIDTKEFTTVAQSAETNNAHPDAKELANDTGNQTKEDETNITH